MTHILILGRGFLGCGLLGCGLLGRDLLLSDGLGFTGTEPVAAARLHGYGHEQSYLGAATGLAADLRAATVALHPADDRSSYAVPVLVHRGRVEADATVSYEDARQVGLHLGVQRHRGDL